jgi:transcriptional regulator with XRE-family HTH domain
MGTNRLRKGFGAVVRRRRKAAGLTQEGLAHATGLSSTFISLVENGHKAPTILVVRQLALALGLTAALLVAERHRGDCLRGFGRVPAGQAVAGRSGSSTVATDRFRPAARRGNLQAIPFFADLCVIGEFADNGRRLAFRVRIVRARGLD